MPDELSGRELDAAVARVLGWTNLAVSDWDHDAANPLDWGGVPPTERRVYRVPRYSTSVDLAVNAHHAVLGWRPADDGSITAEAICRAIVEAGRASGGAREG
jgi:hypothetical protein